MTAGECRLCRRESTLHAGHIAPRFVFRWLKESSVGGIRANEVPNRLIQDGPRIQLLCGACEQRFGRWEKLFSERAFLQLHRPTDARKLVPYDDWALKFAVSVSWRTLQFFTERGFTHLSTDHLEAVKEASETWRRFLLDEVRHPDRFEQHVIVVDAIVRHSTPKLSPYLNRYLLRAVDLDIVSSPSSAFTYTKLCRLMIFGFIAVQRPRDWENTKVHLRKGHLGSRNPVVPEQLFDYWNAKADKMGKAMNSLSPKQKLRIEDLLRRRADEAVVSEVFRAMAHDVAHSGKEAFAADVQSEDWLENEA